MIHKFQNILLILCWMVISACQVDRSPAEITNQELAAKILTDDSLKTVEQMARGLLAHGFQAGKSYPQVWIRDLNTFIEISCNVYDRREIRRQLLSFFTFQQQNGEILDGIAPKGILGSLHGPLYTSPSDPENEGFKNTVKSDQETSLIQAVGKFIKKTSDKSILEVKVNGKTVRQRMALAIEYLMKNRYATQFDLITGATTLDWGDVQPEDIPGTQVSEKTHWCCDIYTNAMFVSALETMIEYATSPSEKQKWLRLKERITSSIRKNLWNRHDQKFLPHLYMKGSPFPDGFDERSIYFHGGTAVAIEAGLLSREEIAVVNKRMMDNVRQSGAPSIGLTIYPPYPKGYFKNEQNATPYKYQNGGDWSWFGGRMIQQLIIHGFVREAYTEIRPMIQRVIENKGFYEWYEPSRFEIKLSGIRWYRPGGNPQGSGNFRGEAGVLAKAIQMLREWALKETKGNQPTSKP